MNWIFEAYTNVYSTALMQGVNGPAHAAGAKEAASAKPGRLARLLGRH
ncbi:MAG: hypothetical protein U1E67_23795 [Hyphomicrobiales bacterium]